MYGLLPRMVIRTMRRRKFTFTRTWPRGWYFEPEFNRFRRDPGLLQQDSWSSAANRHIAGENRALREGRWVRVKRGQMPPRWDRPKKLSRKKLRKLQKNAEYRRRFCYTKTFSRGFEFFILSFKGPHWLWFAWHAFSWLRKK